MNALYPLRFEPVYQPRIWGGRRLETLLHRQLPPGDAYGESWEICDHDAGQSIVESGPLAGWALHELFATRREELLGHSGRHVRAEKGRAEKGTRFNLCEAPSGPFRQIKPGPFFGPNRFPLMLKYLDAADRLSVQVHPDDRMAARLDPPDLGKTEAWTVVAASPGSLIYAGLKPGVTPDKLARAIRHGTCRRWLHAFEAVPGDCVLLPAGTVHALGAGLLVAEIQQASDITFRMFDWNRVGSDGKPRQLHVEQALEAINFDQGQIQPQQPRPTEHPSRCRLVDCDKFLLDRWDFSTPETVGGDGRCHIITVLEGSLAVEGDPADAPLSRGRTVLLPAALGPVQLHPRDHAVLLDVYQP